MENLKLAETLIIFDIPLNLHRPVAFFVILWIQNLNNEFISLMCIRNMFIRELIHIKN